MTKLPADVPRAEPRHWRGEPERPPAVPPVAPPPPAVPAYKPFPVAALPAALREYAEGLAASIKCDPCYAALPALSLAAAAVGAVAVRPKRGFVEPAALWTVVVGASGTAKSPAARPTIEAALDFEQDLRKTFAAAKAAERGRDDDGDKAMPPPAREYFAVSDITIEKLTANFQSSPRGLFVFRDELAGWFNSLTRHSKGGGESDAPQWLSLYDGGSLSYQRRTGEPREVFVRNAVASVAGGIQPAVLRRCLGDETFISNGMASRFLFAMPPEAYVPWTDDELDAGVEADFKAAVARLRGLPFDPQRPARVGLTGEAKALFVAFMNGCQANAEGLADGPMKAAWPKMPRHALRLALVHHCVTGAAIGEDPAKHAVDDLSTAAGVELAGWFAHEADRVYAMLAETEADRGRRHLTDWVGRRGGRATPRDLIAMNRAKYPTAEAAEAALDALVSAGAGAWAARPVGPKGGRPSAAFVLAAPPAEPPAGGPPVPAQPPRRP